jgi:hypothetical protein
MPLTLTTTAGVLVKGTEQQTLTKLSQAFLKVHGLLGNKSLTPNVIGSLHILNPEHCIVDGKPTSVAVIEWKVPSFTFSSREIQLNYIAEATDIVFEASDRKHPKERIWVNVFHAVDGAWGIGGHALTNQQLIDSVSKG